MNRIFAVLLCGMLSTGIAAQGSLDYSDFSMWAAHPDLEDLADGVPIPELKSDQSNAEVAVFFVHPTTYVGKKRINNLWNAPIDNVDLNDATARGTIKQQASIFNAEAEVWAPRYRQAHIHTYYPKKVSSPKRAKEIFDFAYTDVYNAFEHFINHIGDKPFIIAGHSQGAQHAIRLVKEEIDGRPLQNKMIAAYLVGMPLEKDHFESIPICENPNQIGCFVTWRTYRKGGKPRGTWRNLDNIAVVNPITWTTDEQWSEKIDHKGLVVGGYDHVLSGRTKARVAGNVLWVTRPRFPWSWAWMTKNYHIGDFNIFWMDVRENVVNRINVFLNKR